MQIRQSFPGRRGEIGGLRFANWSATPSSASRPPEPLPNRSPSSTLPLNSPNCAVPRAAASKDRTPTFYSQVASSPLPPPPSWLRHSLLLGRPGSRTRGSPIQGEGTSARPPGTSRVPALGKRRRLRVSSRAPACRREMLAGKRGCWATARLRPASQPGETCYQARPRRPPPPARPPARLPACRVRRLPPPPCGSRPLWLPTPRETGF